MGIILSSLYYKGLLPILLFFFFNYYCYQFTTFLFSCMHFIYMLFISVYALGICRLAPSRLSLLSHAVNLLNMLLYICPLEEGFPFLEKRIIVVVVCLFACVFVCYFPKVKKFQHQQLWFILFSDQTVIKLFLKSVCFLSEALDFCLRH